MKGDPDERAMRLGEYIVETGATVRRAAAVFGVSKSTVHKDVTHRLQRSNKVLYGAVQHVLAANKAARHMRGGEATKQKYLHR